MQEAYSNHYDRIEKTIALVVPMFSEFVLRPDPLNPETIRLEWLSKNSDHIYMDLLENAPFNLGRNKLYEGVAGNLVAYACKISFQNGFAGYVSFNSKTQLIEHNQKSLNAINFGGQLMIINTLSANTLIDKYFKNE